MRLTLDSSLSGIKTENSFTDPLMCEMATLITGLGLLIDVMHAKAEIMTAACRCGAKRRYVTTGLIAQRYELHCVASCLQRVSVRECNVCECLRVCRKIQRGRPVSGARDLSFFSTALKPSVPSAAHCTQRTANTMSLQRQRAHEDRETKRMR